MPPKKPTVLVVDNDEDIMEMIRLTLEPEGYRVLLAPTVAAAKALILEHRNAIDLVLTDWNLGDGRGDQVIVAAKEHRIKVAVMTAGHHNRPEIETHQPDDILLKPFNPSLPEQIRPLLEEVLDPHQAGTDS